MSVGQNLMVYFKFNISSHFLSVYSVFPDAFTLDLSGQVQYRKTFLFSRQYKKNVCFVSGKTNLLMNAKDDNLRVMNGLKTTPSSSFSIG